MASIKSVYTKPAGALDRLGEELAFYIRALMASPRSIKRYPREILRILAEVTLGSGALAVIGGTVGVILAMTFFTGAQVGLSGYAALDQLGTAPFAVRSHRSWPASPWPRPSAAASPPSSAPCASPRRSTPSR